MGFSSLLIPAVCPLHYGVCKISILKPQIHCTYSEWCGLTISLNARYKNVVISAFEKRQHELDRVWAKEGGQWEREEWEGIASIHNPFETKAL